MQISKTKQKVTASKMAMNMLTNYKLQIRSDITVKTDE